MLTSEKDSPADVIAFLARRKCGVCRFSLGTLTVASVSRSPYSPKFRCLPPIPTCWNIACPGCGQSIMVCVRKGKAWAHYPAKVTRRSPATV